MERWLWFWLCFWLWWWLWWWWWRWWLFLLLLWWWFWLWWRRRRRRRWWRRRRRWRWRWGWGWWWWWWLWLWWGWWWWWWRWWWWRIWLWWWWWWWWWWMGFHLVGMGWSNQASRCLDAGHFEHAISRVSNKKPVGYGDVSTSRALPITDLHCWIAIFDVYLSDKIVVCKLWASHPNWNINRHWPWTSGSSPSGFLILTCQAASAKQSQRTMPHQKVKQPEA